MNPAGFHRFVRFSGRHRLLFLIGTTAAVLLSLSSLAISLAVRHIFEHVLPQRRLPPLLAGAGIVILLYAAQSMIFIVTRLAIVDIVKRATCRMRKALFEKLYSLPRSFYHRVDRGHLHNSIVQDTERVESMANGVVCEVVPAVAVVLMLSGLLLTIHWMMFLIVVILLVPTLIVSRGIFRPKLQRAIKTHHGAFERFSRTAYRVLELIDMTRLHTAEKWESDRFEEQIERVRKTSRSVMRVRIWMNSLQQTLIPASGVAILIIGGAFVAQSQLSNSDLISFYVTVVMLRGAVGTLVTHYPRILEGRAAMCNVAELLDRKEKCPYQGHHKLGEPSSISIRHVSFGYGRHKLLRDVSLKLEVGRAIAVSGINGSGKTTLLYLLLGLYRPHQGELQVDDIPYDELDIVHLRRQFGVAWQQPQFFSGTIRENLAYGCPLPDEGRMIDSARLATAHEFISGLPAGYETQIGEDGIQLSGGQRQRLAVARALLRQPRFLILDEPSNHLDRSTVENLLKNVRRLPTCPAIALISHDPLVLKHADVSYRLENGLLRAA